MKSLSLMVVFLVVATPVWTRTTPSCPDPHCPTCPNGYHAYYSYSNLCRVCKCRPDISSNNPHLTTSSPTRSAGSVRLVGGLSKTEGRLEIYHNGEWGTVCDDKFTDASAAVACKMLGLPTSYAVAYANAHFGQGTGRIWLDDMFCMGNESTLLECPHRPWDLGDCNHNEDVGVACPAVAPTTNGIRLRLTGGQSSTEGRLEVFHNGTWGTICDDGFDNAAAAVACRMLDLPTFYPVAFKTQKFGGGSGQIWLDDLTCQGTESSLIHCAHSSWGVENCAHQEDVGISCLPAALEGNIRLTGGQSNDTGRVEIVYHGEWGTICDDAFSDAAAAVVCRMLGFNTSDPVALTDLEFGQGSGKIWLDDVSCQGNETTLLDCGHQPLGTTNCRHSEDVAVSCSVLEGSVRLTGGPSNNTGRVEIFHAGQWGTVCDDRFSDAAAAVVCNMLGLPTSNAVANANAYYGRGSGKIWLDNVVCQGNESTILNCAHRVLGANDCGHSEDASVSCSDVSSTPSSNLKLRLVGGLSPTDGRLEIFHNGTWGTVCDDSFTDASAAVACRMLGLPTSNAVSYAAAHFGEGTGRIWLDDLYCTGSESSLTHCAHQSWGIENCDHKEDVGISCS